MGVEKLSKQDELVVKVLRDPVLWAESTLRNPKNGRKPLVLREYQKEMLRDRSKRKVSRMGRRCMAPGTPILMKDGTWKGIEEVKAGEYVASWDDSGILTSNRVLLEYNNGIKDIYEITFSNGTRIKCTKNHPLLRIKNSNKDWVSIEEGLKIGDYVVSLKEYDEWIGGEKNHLLNNKISNLDKDNFIKYINKLFNKSGICNINKDNEGDLLISLILSHKDGLLLEDIRLNLLKIGINSIVVKDIKSSYLLKIEDMRSIDIFLKEIGFIEGKESICEEILEIIKNNIKDNDGGEKNFNYTRIIDIQYKGKSQTYDIEVEYTHNFISNGIVSHNTGKTTTMAIFILWYVFTHENAKIVIATPYESQIRMIFEMLRQFIDTSPVLKESIKSMTKSPYLIKMKNESMISGFTTGVKSGNQGGSIRGQAADWVFMDEVDYMGDADFETVYAIALEAPSRIGVWISSTPTGRRGKFYQACMNKDVWKEFYYPSNVNPEWNPDMEKELRSMFSEMGYLHEVCLTPGSMIQTDNGLRAIEEIKIGDKVITHKGRERAVSYLFERYIDEEIYKIKISLDNSELNITYNHRIYAIKGNKKYFKEEDLAPQWIDSKNIEIGDYILYPINKVYSLKDIDITDCFIYNNNIYIPVISVYKYIYKGKVYNIEVKEDNSYCVGFKCVHNCAEFGEETVGVFKKVYIDRAKHIYDYIERPTYNAIRILGVDWDRAIIFVPLKSNFVE